MPQHHKQYEFDISLIFKRAFALSKVNNWILVQGLMLIIILTIIIFSIFVSSYDGGKSLVDLTNNSQITANEIMPQSYQAAFELVMTILLAPLWTGVTMNAIASNRNQNASFINILSYYRYLPILALGSLLVSFLLTLGFMLFIIPGFYLFTATTFTLPLIVDKQYKPIKAIKESIVVVNTYLFKMLGLYFIFLIMFFFVILSFGFAYIWFGPFYFNVKAVLYQDLFCDDEVDVMSDNNEQNTGVFHA